MVFGSTEPPKDLTSLEAIDRMVKKKVSKLKSVRIFAQHFCVMMFGMHLITNDEVSKKQTSLNQKISL